MIKSIALSSVLLILASGCESVSSMAASETGGFESSTAAPDLDRIGTPIAMFAKESRGSLPGQAAPIEAPATVEVIQRQIIYSAGLRLTVVSTADAMGSVQRIASDVGGYMQESDARSITIRVPAAQFDGTIAKIAALGEVVDRSIKASDVTEQFLDLEIRLDNARKTRDRLLEHLKKSERLEDTIKLEAEISRVSTEIEQIEGKLRFMKSQIAMSTIKVELNATQPQTMGGPKVATPFDWIARLGDGLVAGNTEPMPRQPRIFAGGPKFDPPAGFVRYFSSPALVEAMDADGVRIKLQRQPNFDKGPIEFWQKLIRKALVEGRAIAVTKEGPLDGDPMSTHLVGTREVAGQTWGYFVAISRTNDYVYTYEAWAPKTTFDARLPSLIASAKSLKR